MIGISEELKNTDPDLLSPLTLAFIGDTVFDLLVRGNLVMQRTAPSASCIRSRRSESVPPLRRGLHRS